MDRGPWPTADMTGVHGVITSWTRLSMHVHTTNLLKQLIQAPAVVTAVSTLDSILTEVICFLKDCSSQWVIWELWSGKEFQLLECFNTRNFSCYDLERCRLRSLRFLILRLFSFACLNKASTKLLQGFYIAVGQGNFNLFPQVSFLRDHSSVQLPNPLASPQREWWVGRRGGTGDLLKLQLHWDTLIILKQRPLNSFSWSHIQKQLLFWNVEY